MTGGIATLVQIAAPFIWLGMVLVLRPRRDRRARRATVDERHTGENAELAKIQATRITGALTRRLRGAPATQLLTIQRPPPDQR